MAASNEKSQPLTADAQPPAVIITHPQKATLSDASTICAIPVSGSPRDSFATPRTENGVNPFDTDMEANLMSQTTTRKSCQLRKSDCQVWPSKDHWREKAQAAKKKRTWNCMAGLSRRNKLIAKILLGLLLVGIAVGVGFGVSKPLGAPIWGNKDKY